MMNGVLRGLTWLTCLVSLDDIVVYTTGSIERHILELATVLELLRVAGLTLKLKRCVVATRTMEYLGHELSSDGVRPVARLVTAVSEFPRPKDVVEVIGFVHLAGYYRTFIEAFGSMMQPMTRLLKKDVEWEWTEAQEYAFERVKAMLTMKPLLVYPNFALPFRLVTDANGVARKDCSQRGTSRGGYRTERKTEEDDPAEYAARLRAEDEEMMQASRSSVGLTPVSEVAPAVDASADNVAAAVDEQENQQTDATTTGAQQELAPTRQRTTKTIGRHDEAAPDVRTKEARMMMCDDDGESTPVHELILQLTGSEITAAQERSKLVKKILAAGEFQGKAVKRMYGLVVIETKHGR
ncbi:unnamed protein product [Phytophthora fragariaefolia]|uniref:Unnamed protein product n=1 Tax=Phytophthora fragariaefolia TaxID=1490495 RepID=A0A9W6Y296_9STRA|nr:unnamed protein product [Phytophthora fragariaefolia]